MPLPLEIARSPAPAPPLRRLRRRVAARAAPLLEPRSVGVALLALAAIAALQQVLLGGKAMGGGWYTHYNNYVIYARSFLHLVDGRDLYARFPAEHWDVFRYSPTFAALMGPFSLLPDAVGVVLWNVLNAAVFVLALARLPALSPRARAFLGVALVPEFLTAVQNTQANVLIAGLVVLAFDLLEEGRPGWAALPVAAGVFLKLYPGLAALLCLLYPGKRRFVAALAGWLVLLGALPLVLVSPAQLAAQYASWAGQVLGDREVEAGLSVMGWLRAWFGLDLPNAWVILAGAAGLLAPLARREAYASPLFRLLFLASILVWMVVFNHRSESATYFIAVAGVGLWYFARPRGGRDRALFAAMLLLTSMSPHFPDRVLVDLVRPLVLKAVPCILVWLFLAVELATFETRTAPAAPEPRPA